MIKRYISLFKSNPIVTALMSSLVIGYSICLLYIILIAKDSSLYETLKMIPSMLIFGALIGGFLVFPVLLSIINLIYLFTLKKDELSKREEVKVEVTTMIIGSLIIYHL